jgi:1-phosphatidylinositol-4-phosphate 5-kinase
MNLMKGNIKTLNELSSSGRSGSFLYFSMDNKFILKTITDNEF